MEQPPSETQQMSAGRNIAQPSPNDDILPPASAQKEGQGDTLPDDLSLWSEDTAEDVDW